MYDLVAVDLDGTLLNSEHQVSAKNKQAISDVIAAGKMFTVSTGRPLQGVRFVIDMVDADMPFIIYNGAMVVTSRSNRVLHQSALSGDLAAMLVRFGQARDTTVFVYAGGMLHVAGINQMVKAYMSAVDISPIVVDDLAGLAEKGVTKVLWCDDADRIVALQDEVSPYVKGTLNFYTSRPMLLEFIDINTSKGAAMKKIGEFYGIPRSRMLAIGDSYNDVDMLKFAAFGVAMENSPQEIKDLADAVTLSNDEDGVAEAIYRYVLDG